MALFAWNLVTVFFVCYFVPWPQLRSFVYCCNRPTDSESSTIVPRLSGRQSSVRNQVLCFLRPIPFYYQSSREMAPNAWTYFRSFFCHFWPLSSHYLFESMTKRALQSGSEGWLWQPHFLLFLSYFPSFLLNARKPIAAIFYLAVQSKNIAYLTSIGNVRMLVCARCRPRSIACCPCTS